MAKKTTKKTENKPAVEENHYSMVLSTDEMFSIVQILSFSKDIFEQMALNCLKEGDQKASQVYSARSQLSLMLYERFRDIAGIGEPKSREIH